MFGLFNLPVMGGSSKEKTEDEIKNEIYESTPDFFKADIGGDDIDAFLDALGAPKDASDDTISQLIGALTPSTQDKDDPNAFERLIGAFLPQGKGSGGAGGLLELLGPLAISSFLKDRGYTSPKIPSNAYEGSIPEYTAVREQVTGRDDTNRRPGSGGRL